MANPANPTPKLSAEGKRWARIVHAGYDARSGGKHPRTNPYQMSTHPAEAKAWLRGWQIADRTAETRLRW